MDTAQGKAARLALVWRMGGGQGRGGKEEARVEAVQEGGRADGAHHSVAGQGDHRGATASSGFFPSFQPQPPIPHF